MPAAHDLSELVRNPDNADLALDFRFEYDAHRSTVEASYAEIYSIAGRHEPGQYEQFFISVQDNHGEPISSRSIFIGVAALCIAEARYVPHMIDAEAPNLALFICKPFRGQGVGSAAVRQLLEVADANFGGAAWTLIRQTNIPSQKAIIGAGFTQVGEDPGSADRPPVNFYTYRAAASQA